MGRIGKVKLIIISILILFLMLQGLTGGQFLDTAVPNHQNIEGRLLCSIGGFIYNPSVNTIIGPIPVPAGDDLAAGVLLAGIMFFLFFRNITSKKRQAIATFATIIIGLYLYKLIGLIMVFFAEVAYSQSNCVSAIDLGIITLQYSWFEPLFIIFILSAIFTSLGLAYKIWWGKGLKK